MIEKYSHGKVLLLHLYPGILITVLYLIMTPTVNQLGFPSLLALMISFLVVIVPTELGLLLYQSKRALGRLSLTGILSAKSIPAARMAGVVGVAILTTILVVGATQLIDQTMKERLFAWLPAWYFYDSEFEHGGYARQALVITAVFRLFIDGLVIPITEELYFRGYLLERIRVKGLFVPIYASILFALYHFWQPWNYPSLLVISAILVFPVWYYGNYRIAVYIHTIINTIGATLFLLLQLRG